ncbi:MAG: hypothetical protein AB8D78_11270 [Akkermansiaceae bacterium]
MISGKQLLPILIGAALGAGGWLYGLRSGSASGGFGADERLRIAEEEIQMLKAENDSLRSLAQGGGEVSVPQEMIDKVEKDHGLNFLSNPVVNMIAGEELGYRIEAALESRLGPQGMGDREEAYRRIGWLKSGDRLLTQLVAVRSVGALAWFDEQTGEAWVTDQFNLKNVPDQAAMVRVLVRILLHQHFPPAPTYPGDDAARAREALHAGAASAAVSRFYADAAKGVGFMPLKENGPAQRLMLSLPDFIQGVTLFPALAGKDLVRSSYVKGTEEFTKTFRDPRQTTYQIVLPAEDVREVEIKFPEIGDEIFLRESAGYLGLRLWIEEMGDVGVAEEIARAWVADAFLLFGDGEMSSGLIWDIELESKDFADRLERLSGVRAEAMKATRVGRFFGVNRISPTRIRFLNTATAKTLEKFSATE